MSAAREESTGCVMLTIEICIRHEHGLSSFTLVITMRLFGLKEVGRRITILTMQCFTEFCTMGRCWTANGKYPRPKANAKRSQRADCPLVIQSSRGDTWVQFVWWLRLRSETRDTLPSSELEADSSLSETALRPREVGGEKKKAEKSPSDRRIGHTTSIRWHAFGQHNTATDGTFVVVGALSELPTLNRKIPAVQGI